MSESRPEWILTDLAVTAAGGVTVPIYPTLSAAQARYILSDSGARIAVVSTIEQLEKVQAVRHQLPSIEAVILMEGPTEGQSPSVIPFDAVRERGHARMVAEWGVAREFRDAARACCARGSRHHHLHLGNDRRAQGRDAHARSARGQHDVGRPGARRARGRRRALVPAAQPRLRADGLLRLSAVRRHHDLRRVARDHRPRRARREADGVHRACRASTRSCTPGSRKRGSRGPPAKSAIFRWAVNVGMARGRALLSGRRPSPLLALQSSLADRLVFSKIRNGVGGRLRYLVSGSAPLGVERRRVLSRPGPADHRGLRPDRDRADLTVNPPSAPRAGTVGKAVTGVELRIAADGEILARGPNLMTGYYNKPDATAEAIQDGWLHTGDIGSIDADGYLAITDRKKDLLVTSGGKKIAPQPIENVLKQSPLIAEAVVLGDRRKFAAALIVPDFAALERRLRDLGQSPSRLRLEPPPNASSS